MVALELKNLKKLDDFENSTRKWDPKGCVVYFVKGLHQN